MIRIGLSYTRKQTHYLAVVVIEVAAAAAAAAYSGRLGVRSSFPPVTMTLAVGCDCDNDSVPQVCFRGKSWKKYIHILKYGENSKYPRIIPGIFARQWAVLA